MPERATLRQHRPKLPLFEWNPHCPDSKRMIGSKIVRCSVANPRSIILPVRNAPDRIVLNWLSA